MASLSATKQVFSSNTKIVFVNVFPLHLLRKILFTKFNSAFRSVVYPKGIPTFLQNNWMILFNLMLK